MDSYLACDRKGVRDVDLQVTTLDGLDAVLDEAKVAEFQAALRGPLIQPGDEGYDEQRQVWNANIDRRPALIARCAGVADVITCVNFARETFCWCRCGEVAIMWPATPSAMAAS